MQKPKAKSSSESSLSEPLTRKLLKELANLRDDGIGRFRPKWNRLYGRLSDDELLQRRDELRLLWTAPLSRIDFNDPTGLANSMPLVETIRTKAIMGNIKHSPRDPIEKIVCDHWLRQTKHPWTVEWGRRKLFLAHPSSLPAVLALACVRHADCFGICRNDKCVAPYFFKRRRDQRYCSKDCSWPAQKAAKLRWWNKHGNRSRPKKS
jgi:hypothetical protein